MKKQNSPNKNNYVTFNEDARPKTKYQRMYLKSAEPSKRRENKGQTGFRTTYNESFTNPHRDSSSDDEDDWA